MTIEDDQALAEYEQKILSDLGFVVYTADDAPRGLRLIRQLTPDLVLLDLHLPSINGESVLQEIRSEFNDLPIIIVTAENAPTSIARSLNLGAEDYVTKPFSPEELIARIRARLRLTASHQKTLQLADLEMNVFSHNVTRAGQPIELTAQEFKLLSFLLEHPNQVLSRDSILGRIWASSPEIETRVVDVYIGYLRKKIDVPFTQPLIHSVRGFGYVIKAPSVEEASSFKNSKTVSKKNRRSRHNPS